ncbi:MAG: cation:H+ antiporter [Gammaproteobacteria bacterium]|jgi:cation:H+ antiporter
MSFGLAYCRAFHGFSFMIEAYIGIVVGLGLLTFGADRFVEGAAVAASNFGIPPLLVGLTIVGFATSAPELLVAGVASMNGNPSIAVGNAIGSNIANIGLVVGVTALIMPLNVKSRVLAREFPIMFICFAVAFALCWDGYLGFSDGVVLFVGLLGLIGVTTWLGMTDHARDSLGVEMETHINDSMTTKRAVFWLIVGLGLLLFGSDLLVDGAVIVARHFGISDLVIGLTIVAIGTSLPELAASVASALKGEPDIALGNVIGSNMFNALGVLAVPAIIYPSQLESAVMSRDFPIMICLSVVLFVMAVGWRRNGRLSRIEGTGLLLAFGVYQWMLYVSS